MAPFATIYTYPGNVRLIKTFAAAAANDLEIVEAPNFTPRVSNKTPEFLAKFPLGKIPTLETATGFTLAESAAIFHYVADAGPKRDQLIGATPEERATIQQWIQHDLHEITPSLVVGLAPRLGYAEHDEVKEAAALEVIKKFVGIMEAQLKKGAWIAGTKEYSMADLALASSIYSGCKLWFGKAWRDEFPMMMAWLEKVQNLPKAGAAFPKIEFAQ